MEELKSEIKQIKNQILVGIKEDKIDYTWGKMIIDTCDKSLTLTDVVVQSEQLDIFNNWVQSDKTHAYTDIKDLLNEYLENI